MNFVDKVSDSVCVDCFSLGIWFSLVVFVLIWSLGVSDLDRWGLWL